MKKIMILAALSVCGLAAAQNPTSIKLNNVRSVEIERTDSSQTIRIDGTDDEPEYHYSNSITLDESTSIHETVERDPIGFDLFSFDISGKEDPRHSISLGSIEWAYYVYCRGEMPEYNPWHNDLVSVGFLRYTFRPTEKWGFSVGLGMEQFELFLKNQDLNHEDDKISFAEGDFRSFTAESFVVPASISYRFSPKTSLSLGVDLKIGDSGSLHGIGLSPTGYKVKIIDESFENTRRMFRYDVNATFYFYRQYGIRFRFSPQSPFRHGMGPQFQSFSFGIVMN